MRNKPEVTYTYKDIATATGATLNSLYAVVTRNPGLLPPIDPTANLLEFTQEVYDAFLEWWEENSHYRVDRDPPEGEAFTIEEAQEYLGVNFATFQHNRRRHNLLYPDYYLPNPAGRGRPIAMYLKTSLDAFTAWVEAGRPEPEHAQVRFVLLDQGKFEAIVHFRDGTAVAIVGDEAEISPPSPDAEHYIRFARMKFNQEKRKIARRNKRNQPLGRSS